MRKKKKTKSSKRRKKSDYEKQLDRAKNAFDEILELTSGFCQKYLPEEYRELCEDLTYAVYEEGLPLEKGRPAGWASGIVHAAGFVNFLQDPKQTPHMTCAQLAEAFGVSQQTMQTKSKIIRDELDLMQLDPDWCLPSLLKDNPLVWMLKVDGFIMDARTAPRQVQEEAYRLGLIPYIPADRQEHETQSGNGTRIIEFPSKRNNTPAPESAQKAKDDGPNLFEGSEG